MDVILQGHLPAPPTGSTLLHSHGNFYHNLLAKLGYAEAYPPVADLLRRSHGLSGTWCVASPIHWQATHNNAVMVACGDELQLSEADSRQWLAAWSEFVAFEGMDVHYHDAGTWLLKVDGKPELHATPVHQLLQRPFMPELERLRDTSFWQRLLTECQMFFSAHPLHHGNQPYPINGVWFWGQGNLNALCETRVIACHEHLMVLGNILSSRVSTTFESWQNGVVLWETQSHDNAVWLQQTLQHKTVRWYWNNLAYETCPKHWWSRLWRV